MLNVARSGDIPGPPHWASRRHPWLLRGVDHKPTRRRAEAPQSRRPGAVGSGPREMSRRPHGTATSGRGRARTGLLLLGRTRNISPRGTGRTTIAHGRRWPRSGKMVSPLLGGGGGLGWMGMKLCSLFSASITRKAPVASLASSICESHGVILARTPGRRRGRLFISAGGGAPPHARFDLLVTSRHVPHSQVKDLDETAGGSKAYTPNPVRI